MGRQSGTCNFPVRDRPLYLCATARLEIHDKKKMWIVRKLATLQSGKLCGHFCVFVLP